MINQSFSTAISATATPQQAIAAINNVTGWWATNVKGNTENVNDIFTVRFGKTFATIEVIEVIPHQKVVWLIANCDLPLFANPKDWLNTKITWRLSSANNTTQINFMHDGLTPDKSCYEDCKKGWTFFVTESLQKLITEGKGLPGTGIFSYIISDGNKYEGLLYFKNDSLPDYPDGFIYVDVKATKGECVTSAYNVGKYNKTTFNPSLLKGEHFMIIENKPLYNNLSPLKDILELIN
jgi:hypothetical protein